MPKLPWFRNRNWHSIYVQNGPTRIEELLFTADNSEFKAWPERPGVVNSPKGGKWGLFKPFTWFNRGNTQDTSNDYTNDGKHVYRLSWTYTTSATVSTGFQIILDVLETLEEHIHAVKFSFHKMIDNVVLSTVKKDAAEAKNFAELLCQRLELSYSKGILSDHLPPFQHKPCPWVSAASYIYGQSFGRQLTGAFIDVWQSEDSSKPELQHMSWSLVSNADSATKAEKLREVTSMRLNRFLRAWHHQCGMPTSKSWNFEYTANPFKPAGAKIKKGLETTHPLGEFKDLCWDKL